MAKRSAEKSIVHSDTKKPVPKILPRSELHLLDDIDADNRLTFLDNVVGLECSECKELFTRHTVAAHPGRMVVINMETKTPTLYFCSHCAYFYSRVNVHQWRERKSTKLGAPLTRDDAENFILSVEGFFTVKRFVVVVIPVKKGQ